LRTAKLGLRCGEREREGEREGGRVCFIVEREKKAKKKPV